MARRFLAALHHEVVRGISLQELHDGPALQSALAEVAGRSSESDGGAAAVAADLLNLILQENIGGKHDGIVSLSMSVRGLLHDEAVDRSAVIRITLLC